MLTSRFFASYHGVLKALRLYNPQQSEVNIGIAGITTLIPLVAVGKLRPMFPYAVMLIVLDIVNGIGGTS
jgi:hypothetical protein